MRAHESSAQLAFGAARSDAELLEACGIKPAVAAKLAAELGSGSGVACASAEELRAHGVPPQLAGRIAAAFEYARRAAVRATYPRQVVGRPEDIFEIFYDLRFRAEESFHIACIDVRNALIGRVQIAIGQVADVAVHPREVFRPAIRLAAAGIMLVHNHPSGDPSPSDQDLAVTRRLREVGDVVGIPVVDHIIVAARGFRSLSEHLGTTW